MNSKFSLFIISFVCFFLFACRTRQTDYVQYVNPFVGTGGHGHTYPGAVVPFGMVQISPDNNASGWDWCSGYHFSDNTVAGFSQTHLSGTGGSDMLDVTFTPTSLSIRSDTSFRGTNFINKYFSHFDHKNEKATPGYYSVLLNPCAIKAELTATIRCGFHKYTFQKDSAQNIIIDLANSRNDLINQSHINIIGNDLITGCRGSVGWVKDHKVFFAAQFSKKFAKAQLIDEKGQIQNNISALKGLGIKVALSFNSVESEIVMAKIGISSVSEENALKNLDSEIKNWDFENVREKAASAWNKELSSVEIESSDSALKTTFYTALYHSLLTPSVYSDVDGKFRDSKNKIHQSNGTEYHTYSLWDTYRAQQPMLALLKPSRDVELIKSMITFSETEGFLPKWSLWGSETNGMIGYHAIPVIADAYIKGLQGLDIQKAYKAMKNSAMRDDEGLKYYKKYGFIPADFEKESVSKTLEYAYDDWCIAQIAKRLNLEEDYNLFSQRAQYYKNVFDDSTGFSRPKNSDGTWIAPFDPYERTMHYTEGNPWHYTMYVPHDFGHYINQFGGVEKVKTWLDTLFSTTSVYKGGQIPDISGMIGQYAQGNEPSHHVAYLYDYLGEGWKTQKIVRQIVDSLYTSKIDGICGNDDCGQMSAWYVFSAMGFYPVCPGSDEYAFGSPLFECVKLKLENGKTFTIKSKNVSYKNKYIQKITFNGQNYTKLFISYGDIENGGELIFEMSDKPNKKFGIEKQDMPYIEEVAEMPAPPYISWAHFLDTGKAKIECQTPGCIIKYQLNNEIDWKVYNNPFALPENSTIRLQAFKDGYLPGTIVTVNEKDLKPLPETLISNPQKGLKFSYYELVTANMPDFSKIKAVNSSIINTVLLKPKQREDHWAIVYSGYIQIQTSDIYRFELTSDDGSILYINNQVIVNNDGCHGDVKATGLAPLKKGFYPFRLEYFENVYGETLKLNWESTSIKMQTIPETVFYH